MANISAAWQSGVSFYRIERNAVHNLFTLVNTNQIEDFYPMFMFCEFYELLNIFFLFPLRRVPKVKFSCEFRITPVFLISTISL